MTVTTDTWTSVRDAAQQRAAHLGLPTRALEAWRYVDCKPLATTSTGTATDIAATGGDNWALQPLSQLDTATQAAHAQRWQTCISTADDIGTLWSLSKLHDGLQATVAAGKQASPLHLRIQANADSGHRIVVRLERGAQASLIIEYALGAGRAAVGLEIDVADGAHLHIEERQSGEDRGQLLTSAWAHIQRDANVHWTCSWSGGDLVRARVKVVLHAAGAHLDYAGLARITDKRQAHQFLRVHHHAADTTSVQLVKNVIDGYAKCSFDGLVHIAKGADRSNAQQTNHNLLLSPHGRADTRPQLDIFADDVKAAHGATVGRPEDEEIVYLRTRGLSLDTARRLVQQGFSDEILHRFRHVNV